MSQRHRGGFDRHFAEPEDHSGRRHHSGRHERSGRGLGRGHGERRGPRRGERLFDYGELRLLLLAMIAERPRYGYELIKEIEERFGGSYSPSPGVIYPTLAWLDDMGYAAIEAKESGRKLYRITAEGGAFLEANRTAAEELQARGGESEGGDGRRGVPAPVVRAMHNLKLALRLRLRQGPLDPQAAESIAAALDAAAQSVERS